MWVILSELTLVDICPSLQPTDNWTHSACSEKGNNTYEPLIQPSRDTTEVAESRTAGLSYGIRNVFIVIQWVTVHWITMKTCRIPYENACRTGFRNLPIKTLPASMVVKDSTPSSRRILRCMNFGIGGSSRTLFLDIVGKSLQNRIPSTVNLERTHYIMAVKLRCRARKKCQIGAASCLL